METALFKDPGYGRRTDILHVHGADKSLSLQMAGAKIDFDGLLRDPQREKSIDLRAKRRYHNCRERHRQGEVKYG